MDVGDCLQHNVKLGNGFAENNYSFKQGQAMSININIIPVKMRHEGVKFVKFFLLIFVNRGRDV